MPQTINFPVSFDDDISLYLAVNNLRTQLTSNISDSVTTIPVTSTADYPEVGFVTILTGLDITKAEAIAYSGIDSTNFFNGERGSDGTTALQHFQGNNVDFTIVSRHHNNAKDSIIALEHFVGVSGSETFPRFTEDGSIGVPGTVIADGITGNFVTISGLADLCFLTVTGTANVSGTFTADTLDASNSLTISGVPVSTGTGSLQEAYDSGDGTIVTVAGKPFALAGTGALTAVTGTFTTDLIVGIPGATSTAIDTTSIVAASGIFDSLTVSGLPINLQGPADGAFRGAVIELTTPTGVAENDTVTISWDTETIDTDDFFDIGTPEDFTIPEGITKVRVSASVEFEADPEGYRQCFISRNGSFNSQILPHVTMFAAHDTFTTAITLVSGPVAVLEGDTFSLNVRHQAGNDLDITGPGRNWFMLEVLEPYFQFEDQLVAISGAFSQSLTVSGIPVNLTGGGGSSDHSALSNLDFASAGHTGFASEAELLTVSGHLQGQIGLVVKETDGDPTVTGVNTIVVTTGTLTDDGGGQVTISTGGGGGGGGDVPDPLELADINATNSLTVSGVPVATGTSLLNAVHVVLTSGITYDHNTQQDVGFDQINLDTDNWFVAHPTGNNRIVTVPPNVEHVQVVAGIEFGPINWRDVVSSVVNTALIDMRLMLNGVEFASEQRVPVPSSSSIMTVTSPVMSVVAGDTISVKSRYVVNGFTLTTVEINPFATDARTFLSVRRVP